jgi:hypothetical protein
MPRRNFTLSIDEDLAHQMKIQAAVEKRDVSTITEELYEKYLDRAERHGAGTLTAKKVKPKK